MITFYWKPTFTKNVKDSVRVKTENRSFYGFYTSPNLDDFWTNGNLFKKVRDAWNENKDENSNARVFLLRPGEEPWKLIDSFEDDQSKIILWYLDAVLYDQPDGSKYDGGFHDYHEIKKLIEKGKDVLLVLQDNDLDNCLTFDYVNTYLMADKVLEQQQNLHLGKSVILRLFENSKSFLRIKHFLSFNGHLKTHRIMLLLFILINELLDKFDISCHSYHWDDDLKEVRNIISRMKLVPTEEWDNQKSDKMMNLTNLHDVEEDIIDRFRNMLPLNLDLKSISHQEAVKMINSTAVNQKLNVPLYFNSYIDVITESNVSDGGVFITEKIFKSLVCLKPFLVVGQYNTLKVLKDYGFKTFSDIIDESYDDEKNWVIRSNIVFREMGRISLLPLEKVDEMYWKIEDILKHNFFHLSKYVSNVDDEVIKKIIGDWNEYDYDKINKRADDWDRMHKNWTGSDEIHGHVESIIKDSKGSQFNRVKEEIDFNKYESLNIIEIGPGDAGLCKLILDNFTVNRYVLVDDPYALSVASNNLRDNLNGVELIPIENLDSIDGNFNVFFSFNCMTETPFKYQEYVYKTFFPRCDEVFICDRWEGFKFELVCEPFRELLNKHLDINFKEYSDKDGLKKPGRISRPGQWTIHGKRKK
jgi:hypothetical protein